MSIRVSIADDHPLVLAGLEKLLHDSSMIELLDFCRNGDALLLQLAKRQPDVLLLDIQMPGKHGDELARYITQTWPKISILVLTNLDQTFHVENMLLNGAMGYLLKHSDKEVLEEAIETVYKGKQFVDPSMKDQILQDMLEARNKAAAMPKLTQREKEVLGLIAGEYTSSEIADKLFISYRTVENHRLNLLFKFGVKNAAGLVRKAIQLGLVD